MKKILFGIMVLVMAAIMAAGLIGFTGCSTQYVLKTGKLIETYSDTTKDGNVVMMVRYYTQEGKTAERALYRVDGFNPGVDFHYVEKKKFQK